MNDCREEEINTSPLESDRNQEMFDFTPSPFSVKEDWILTRARWSFGGMSPPSFWFGLLCGEQYELRLSNSASQSLGLSLCLSSSPHCLPFSSSSSFLILDLCSCYSLWLACFSPLPFLQADSYFKSPLKSHPLADASSLTTLSYSSCHTVFCYTHLFISFRAFVLVSHSCLKKVPLTGGLVTENNRNLYSHSSGT